MPLANVDYPTSINPEIAIFDPVENPAPDNVAGRLLTAQSFASAKYDELIADGYEHLSSQPYVSGLYAGVSYVLHKRPFSAQQVTVRE